MRILILGAGLMARGLLFDLTRQEGVAAISVADRSDQAIAALRELYDDERITWHTTDLTNDSAVSELMTHADGVICAAHYGLNLRLTELAIQNRCHLVDLGGNNTVVEAQLALDPQAQEAGVSIIPDCGLAPGMASLLVAWGARHLEWATSAHIRVGGLPQNVEEPFRYGRLFNVQGLINEYVEVPVALKDGQLVELEPLADLEQLVLPDPLGELEAFNTSGGVSTLPGSYADRFQDIDYKTIRYPGHAHAMRWLYGLGLMDWDPVELDGQQVSPRALLSRQIVEHVPACERDITVVVVRFEGAGQSHELQIIDRYDEESSLTAMMRTTSFPASIVSQMQCSGQINQLGARPQEQVVDCDQFMDELERRGIPLTGRTISAAR
jgi:lysine 6-dehydrogenase